MTRPIVPQGPIYTELRSYLLSTYIDGTQATLNHSTTLSEWFSNGTYNVTSATSQEFILRVASVDFASALLTDVEHLFNHCFEHLQEMICFQLDTRPRSNAWAVVTVYYFAFFCAQALLRLLGMPIVYLKKEKTNDLMRIGGCGTGPSPGAFRLEHVTTLSPSHAEYRLKKIKSKIHDGTWQKLLLLFQKLLSDPSLTSNTTEVQFFSSLTTTALFSSYNGCYDWPSELRNKANYPPGYAYLLVQNDDITKARKMMDGWRDVKTWDGNKGVENLLAASVSNCAAGKNSSYSSHVQLLYDISLCLFMLSRSLYSELLIRRGIDKRWEANRARFRMNMTFPENEYSLIAQVFNS